MARILTVAREFGSGGATISRIVAERLNWRLLDRELLEEVVKMAGVAIDQVERCDERLDPVFHRLLKSLWQGGFERSTGGVPAEDFDSEAMTRCARAVIEHAAEQGNCVIVGRGAQCLLQEKDEALHVFIWAPRAYRIQRVRERFAQERDPEALMDRIDRGRSAFMQREFNVNWRDHRLYDLMINSTLGDELTARLILAALQGESRANA